MEAFEVEAVLTLITDEFDKRLKNSETKAGGFGTALGKAAKIGAAALAAASAAIVKVGVDSVQTGKEFDQSMSQVYATMGDKAQEAVEYNGQTVSSMEALRDFALEMGRTTQYTASQSAEALNYMALAGYDAETSIGMLPNVMALASAGAFDLATASDMITDTQTAFGISLDRTTQMVDEMAKAASTGNTSVEQLGQAFLVVGGLAQELNGGMVTLADGTTQNVDGIQELEIALTAMANAGVKGSEAGTHMRNMLLKLASPTSDGTKQLEALGVAVWDSEGRMRSLKDIMGDLSGALDGLTQEEKIQAIGDLFNTRDLAAAEALLGAVNQSWDDIGEAILNADGAAKQMQETQLDNLAGDITIFKSALDGAKIAISDRLTPTIREFVQFGTDGVSKLADAFQSDGITGAAEVFGNIISDGVKKINQKLPELLKAAKTLVSTLIKGISSALPDLISLLPELVQTFLDLILEAVSAIVEALPSIISAIGAALPDIIRTIFDYLPQIIDAILSALPDIIVAICDALPDIVIAIVEALPALIEGVATAVLENFEPILVAVATGLLRILDKLGSWFMELIGFVDEEGDGIWDNVGEWFANLFSSIGEWFANIFSSVGDFFANVWNSVVEGCWNIYNSVTTWRDNVISTIAGFISNLIGKVASFFSSIWTSITSWFSTIINKVVSFVTDIPNKIQQGFAAVRDAGLNLVKGLWNGISDAAGWVLDKIRGFGQSILDGIKSIFGIASPSKAFAWIGRMLDEGLAGGVDKYAHLAIDSAEALSDGINDAMSLDGMDMSKQVAVNYSSPTATAQNSKMDVLIGLFGELRDELKNMKIVLDSGETVGGLISEIDEQLNYRSVMTSRGMA